MLAWHDPVFLASLSGRYADVWECYRNDLINARRNSSDKNLQFI